MCFYPLSFADPCARVFIASATVIELPLNSRRASRKVTKERNRNPGWGPHMSLVTTKLTADDIRKAVELFWTTFLAKSEEELNDFYASGSTVFQIAMGRSEPGRLGAMRRSREYFNPETRMELKLSPIDIVLCGNDAGVASYTFQFQASGRDVGGKRLAEKLETVRATHVMHRDASGKLRIAHEHFSVPVASEAR
jgi:ketosteroid isomerase-like protein